MARMARVHSISGYYHVMMRGVNKQEIFRDDRDRQCFLDFMKQYSEEFEVKIIEYCLMNNHFHMLVYAPANLSMFMRMLAGAYVRYYNKKYDRVGHLFQARYKSKPVESETSLLRVARYVLQNPLKANICSVELYRWSSWDELVGKPHITQPEAILQFFSGKKSLKEFMLTVTDDTELAQEYEIETSEVEKLTAAASKLRRIYGSSDFLAIRTLPRAERNAVLAKAKDAGISVRVLSKLTGVNRNSVQNARHLECT